MSEIRTAVRFTRSLAPLALLTVLTTGVLRAQEIRVVAEPNQSVRMARGGYVCEGQLTTTPIDAAENWTYEMVSCTGPLYDSHDYAALHAKLNHDELVRLNETMDHLSQAQSLELNRDLKETVEKRFQDLPHDVLLTADVQSLKRSLLEYIDQRVPARIQPTPRTPPRSTAPPRTRRGATPPNQP
jgi:hypothetical protein